MARIDGILALLKKQGGTELRMGADRSPKMSRDGEPVTFTMPATSERALMDMVSDLINEHQLQLLEGGQEVLFNYGARGQGTFWLKLYRTDGLQVVVWPGEHGEIQPRDTALAGNPSAATAEPEPESQPPIARAEPTPVSPASSLDPPVTLAPDPPAAPEDTTYTPGPALTRLLYLATSQGASDLHLASGEPATVRIAGKLRHLSDDSPVYVEELLSELLTPQLHNRLRRASVDLALEVPTVGRFRANLYRYAEGLAVAFRILRRRPPALARLNLPIRLDPLLTLPHGLVIVCGPTGSGKSTTIASLMQQRLSVMPGMLITLEDPVEYTFEARAGSLVRQRQVGAHCESFSLGLRDALREDPDNLLIGEMRDPETITLALTASETGHLVMTSLHSRSAASAVERIVDAYPGERHQQVRVQLADVLQAIIVQQLVPRANGEGRLPVLEVVRATHSVRNIIREGRTSQLNNAIQAGRAEGMLSLERCLADLVANRSITRQTADRSANDPQTLSNYLRA